MLMDFIEPDVQQTVPVSVVLNKSSVSHENKEWVYSLLLKNEIPSELQSDFEYYLEELVKKSGEAGSSSFKAFFLFYYYRLYYPDYGILSLLSDYFDKDKLSLERIKILPELFTQKQNDKPEIFQAYVVNILDGIRNYAKKDTNFSAAYQKKLQEIRASSSFIERIIYYIKLIFQNLLKHTYKECEKLPTQEIFDSLLDFWEEDFLNMPYSIKLVAALEGIPENELYVKYFPPGKLIPKYNILAFPFIVCGKELYTCIHITVELFLSKISVLPFSISTDEIAQIKIPRWNENNYIHEFFLNFAYKLERITNNKASSMLILDKIFDGVNAVDIPYIFFEHIENHVNSIYGVLLKSGFSDVIEPIRTVLEYLDRALTEDTNYPHKIYFEKSRLFLDYIDKISHSAPEDKIELFKELCFKRAGGNHHFQTGRYWGLGERTIKDTLDRIAQKIIRGEMIFPERKKEANDLYEEFVDVIAKGAVKYPVELFLSEGQINIPNDYGLFVIKRYFEKLEIKNIKDALFVSEFWFNYFYLEQPFFSSVISLSYRYSSRLEEEGPFFYKNVFCKFIDNEDFICRFLSIPQNSSSASSLAVYCLACWVLYQFNKNESMSDVFMKASMLLNDEKITFHDKIAEFIMSYKIPDRLLGNGYGNEARRFLFYLTAALGGEQYQNILKEFYCAEEHFPLYYIRYKYSHENFIPEEFLDFLFSLENQSLRGNKNEIYNLELIQEACKKGVLKKRIVLEKVSDYIKKNRKILFISSEIKKFITFFFIETEGSETYEEQTFFFTLFCDRAVQENEDSFTELYLFFRIFRDFHIDTILEKHTDINNLLVTRCCKILNNFRRNIEQKEFPDDKYNYLNDYIFPASNFVWERTGNIWKALKPLILAFRASKDILLNESLCNIPNNISISLLNMITSFFRIEDDEKLKELRYDMANDFAEYLKPAKNERQAEKYTKKERETEGFALSYTEPSPYWRYAYVRALGDLSIKTDKRGHYFQKILENVSEKDPSEDVKSAAKKVMEELDSIRKGYSGANHKKCLFEAFWWLKNAHMLSLGGKVDSKKALEQRNKEWR